MSKQAMSTPFQQLEPYLLPRSQALHMIAQAEGWDAISEFHEREICEIVQLEPEVVSEMAAHVRGVHRDQIVFDDPKLPAKSEENPLVDDDLAMLIRFGLPFADRSPFVSYFSFAVLRSLRNDRYHEAKNYWLSAAASVVNISRRRSWFTRCAYLTLLASALPSPLNELQDFLLLPTFEIILEMHKEAGSLGFTPLAPRPSVDLAPLLRSSLRLAVEENSAQIARGAFPLLA